MSEENQAYRGHTLPVVSNFQERPQLERLRQIWRDEPQQSFIGMTGENGCGKTAILSRFLQELPGSSVDHPKVEKRTDLPAPEAVFTWSFRLQPDVDQFLIALYRSLTGEILPRGEEYSATFRLLQLLDAWKSRPALLVLDGLETPQQGMGEYDWLSPIGDHRLLRLIRCVARGYSGFRVLLTGGDRDIYNLGFEDTESINTDPRYRGGLDPQLAWDILRGRGVKGSNDQLDELASTFGRQVLTFDHLGLILHDFFDGQAKRASELVDLDEEKKIYRGSGHYPFGEFYQRHLPQNELLLLQILSVFRHPMAVSALEDFLSARAQDLEKGFGGSVEEMSGQLPDLLGSLHRRNLLDAYAHEGTTLYGPNTLIRHSFYRSLEDQASTLHRTIVEYLDSLLTQSYRALEANWPESLDWLDEYCYHGVSPSGFSTLARIVGRHTSGSTVYQLMGWRLAAYHRGARMLLPALFDVDHEIPRKRADHGGDLSISSYGDPLHDFGLLLLDLGRTQKAVKTLLQVTTDARPFRADFDTVIYSHPTEQDLIEALLLLGRLPEAEARTSQITYEVEKVLAREDSETDLTISFLGLFSGSWVNPYARRALARGLQGRTSDALRDYEWAEDLERRVFGEELWSRQGLFGRDAIEYTGFLLRLGFLDRAESVLRHLLRDLKVGKCPALTMLLKLSLSDLFRLRGDYSSADEQLHDALVFGLGTGHQEIYCWTKLSQARLALAQDKLELAIEASVEARKVATECDLALYQIDSLATCGRVSLMKVDLDTALELAGTSLRLTSEPVCSYAWGEGNALHLCGEVLLRKGEPKRARSYLEDALALRMKIGDPRRLNTQRLVEGLSGKDQT